MLGTHTDSPALRLKPKSKRFGEGFLQVGVEPYGGGIWHTCALYIVHSAMPYRTLHDISSGTTLTLQSAIFIGFDRDLGLAGRLIIKEQDGIFVSKLVHIDKPILRIPTLAIHLDRSESFAFNKETQLFPIAGLASAEPSSKLIDKDEEAKEEAQDFAPLAAVIERHHPAIVAKLAEAAGVPAESIMDFEILLFDTQKACLGGINDEFIFSARLDNLVSLPHTIDLVDTLYSVTIFVMLIGYGNF